MTPDFDFASAAAALEEVIAHLTDAQLPAATPCAGTTVRDLLAHVIGLTEAFRQAATKESLGRSSAPNPASQDPLPEDWRTRIPAQLAALADAWRAPQAWEQFTEAGGVTAPAPVMARIALDELVVHGWDLAAATGQPFSCADADLDVLLEMLGDNPAEGTPGLFGPVVDVPGDAPLLDRVLALTGRDIAWAS